MHETSVTFSFEIAALWRLDPEDGKTTFLRNRGKWSPKIKSSRFHIITSSHPGWDQKEISLCLFFNFIFSYGAATVHGSGPPHSRGFLITQNDSPQSVGLLWRSDQLVAETSTW